ncbi:MAG: anthranilate synthase component I family protein [Bacteroidales bacterium]
MKKIKLKTVSKKILADTITPVSFFLKARDIFPNAVLLESSDYHGSKGSFSFICLEPLATFTAEKYMVHVNFHKLNHVESFNVDENHNVPSLLEQFLGCFETDNHEVPVNGIFGYTAYDGVKYFEDIKLRAPLNKDTGIPELRYSFFRYIIAINHFQNNLHVIENIPGEDSNSIDKIISLLKNRNFASYHFELTGQEGSNITNEEYMNMVAKGKEHCFRGDVFQIVLSRQFYQQFKGDDFNVYRALRSINPSPYLFYFDFGSYRIFGSSPEAQLEIKNNTAYIHPIAGTFKRTGNDEKDKELALGLAEDPKENAEHVMLVDLARNDLSRNADNVRVETYKEIQYYSHVLHMVSKVAGNIPADANRIRVLADSFPAGTLSGAPKYKAMELIDKYENCNRGYYGGALGFIGLNGELNHAIMIRSFLSKNNMLYYQAGAGIVSESNEESELNEVNNKLAALKNAILMANEPSMIK